MSNLIQALKPWADSFISTEKFVNDWRNEWISSKRKFTADILQTVVQEIKLDWRVMDKNIDGHDILVLAFGANPININGHTYKSIGGQLSFSQNYCGKIGVFYNHPTIGDNSPSPVRIWQGTPSEIDQTLVVAMVQALLREVIKWTDGTSE